MVIEICRKCGYDLEHIEANEKTCEDSCYSCFYGGDGEEICDRGHCWLHNGEVEFVQPPKELGCDEWKPRRKHE